ncbi:O-antigen ligase family protein [Deferribacter desulfuricans]|nr:O-antigen ligase family protein [Deferribacter desulfuricans]
MIIAIWYSVLFLKNIKISFNTFEKILFLFFIYSITITVFTSYYIENSIRLILGIILISVIYILSKNILCFLLQKGISFKKVIIITALIINLVALILYIIGIYEIGNNFILYERERVYGVLIDRAIPRLIGTFSDPNFFVLANTFFFYYLLFMKKNLFEKLTFIIIVINIILTFSRGGIISLSIVLIIYFVVNLIIVIIRNFKIKKFFLKHLFFFIFLVGIIVFLINEDTLFKEMFIKRINSLSEGSGRLEIWLHGLNFFYNNFLLGIGLYNFLPYNIHYYNNYHYMHNTYLEVLVETGIVGFILYILFHIFLLIHILKMYKINKNYIIILLSYFSLFLQMFFLSSLINEIWFLFIAYISVKYKYLSKIKNENESR